MRLSDIKGERVLDVIAEIAAPVINIAADSEALQFFIPSEGQADGSIESFAERMKVAAPALLKTHKDDFVTILAALDGVTPKEYIDGMTLGGVLEDIFELLTDKVFEDFLSSQQSEESQSGLPSEGTEDL